jgi:hypothetical protein
MLPFSFFICLDFCLPMIYMGNLLKGLPIYIAGRGLSRIILIFIFIIFLTFCMAGCILLVLDE